MARADDIVTPALYVAEVAHVRHAPIRRRFSHRVYYWLIDLDQPNPAPVWLRPLARFRPADHIGDPDRSIKDNITAVLAENGIDLSGGRIVMLANARSFDYVFNPISVHWCYTVAGELAGIVAEVHNTYGGRHAYVLRPDDAGRAVARKDFYVSPFLDVDGEYFMRFSPPGERLAITVALRQHGATVFTATVTGRRRNAGTAQLLHALAARPAMSALTSLWIRTHGIRLWARRLPIVPRAVDPAPPARTAAEAVADGEHTREDLAESITEPIAKPITAPITVPAAPHSIVRSAVAAAVFRYAARRLPVQIAFPDGHTIGSRAPDDPEMVINRPREFLSRLGSSASVGFGEAYMAGDWREGPDTDLADLLTPFAQRLTDLVPQWMHRFRRVVDRTHPQGESSSPRHAAANIHRHYDLPPELFEAFLDETMTYSGAWFEAGDDLAAAQRRKIDAVLDIAGVTAGTDLLEIGTGWGELAVRAARRGALVTTITLSREQCEHARQCARRAGVADRVDVQLADYRTVAGSFDAIVSVEMLEAVGYLYWPTFFTTVQRLLRPRGRVGLQTITMAHQRMRDTRDSYGWINKYVFPGGIIPSEQAIRDTLHQHTRLRIAGSRHLGGHYATTLRCWRNNFEAAWPQLQSGLFDETFHRMWRFYLAYCEAGFRTGYLDVQQLAITRAAG